MELSKNSKYTYAGHLTWNNGKQYELIDGEVYMMPAPSALHQELA